MLMSVCHKKAQLLLWKLDLKIEPCFFPPLDYNSWHRNWNELYDHCLQVNPLPLDTGAANSSSCLSVTYIIRVYYCASWFLSVIMESTSLAAEGTKTRMTDTTVLNNQLYFWSSRSTPFIVAKRQVTPMHTFLSPTAKGTRRKFPYKALMKWLTLKAKPLTKQKGKNISKEA